MAENSANKGGCQRRRGHNPQSPPRQLVVFRTLTMDKTMLFGVYMYLTGIYITPIFAAVNQSIKCRLAYIFELVYRPTRSKTRRCFSSSVGLPTDSVDSLISRHFNLDFTDVTVHCARRVFLGHRKLLLWKTRP